MPSLPSLQNQKRGSGFAPVPVPPAQPPQLSMGGQGMPGLNQQIHTPMPLQQDPFGDLMNQENRIGGKLRKKDFRQSDDFMLMLEKLFSQIP